MLTRMPCCLVPRINLQRASVFPVPRSGYNFSVQPPRNGACPACPELSRRELSRRELSRMGASVVNPFSCLVLFLVLSLFLLTSPPNSLLPPPLRTSFGTLDSFTPSREDHLLSDKVISLAGRSFTIHHFGFYLAAAIFLFALFFFLWGYLRGRRVSRARSVPRDELSIYLGRMADSLETLQRVASQFSSTMTAEASRRESSRQEPSAPEYAPQQDYAQRENAPPAATPVRERRSIPYSMFGR